MRKLFVIMMIGLSACSGSPRLPKRSEAPMTMLWAWERPEDLRFIDPATTGVAFLAQTLTLENDEVRFAPRRQPLEVPDGTYLIAVTRIESIRRTESRPVYSPRQLERLTSLIADTLNRPHVRGIQTDFDAVVTERPFYRKLVAQLRSRLPANTPLTITALASWCIGDKWLNGMDVDEAVPMAFVMGADTERVRSYLKSGKDWTEPICRESYGVSVDEPPIEGRKAGRRIYYFKNTPWKPNDAIGNT